MTNYKKIQEAYKILTKEFENSNNTEINKAISLLYEFTLDNTKFKTNTEFKCKDFIDNDELRPNLKCIFHDEKEKVAVGTNGHIMFVNPREYIKPSEKDNTGDGGVLRDSYGRVAEQNELYVRMKYPNWKCVIPKNENTNELNINIWKIKDSILKCKADAKLRDRKTIRYQNKYDGYRIHVANGIWIALEYAELIVRAGGNNWRGSDPTRAFVKKWSDGRILLIMPVANSDDPNFRDEEAEERGYIIPQY